MIKFWSYPSTLKMRQATEAASAQGSKVFFQRPITGIKLLYHVWNVNYCYMSTTVAVPSAV
jgi:hypothetical protein